MDVLLLKKLICFFLFVFVSGCFYFISPIRKAQRSLMKGDCEQAQKFFLMASHKKLKFAEKAAEFCLSKSTITAVWFYTYLSEREEDRKKRLLLKEKLAELYFKELKLYEKAIELYSFLSTQGFSEEKGRLYFFRIALAYFEMGKWEMSLKKINLLIEKNREKNIKDSNMVKELFLKARIFLMQKKYMEAEGAFQKIQKVDPVYFKKNKLFLYLSFIYELQKEFSQAISELEKFQSTSEFLSEKVKRLKIRRSNQPKTMRF